MANVFDGSVNGDDVAGDCPISVDPVQLIVALDVLGIAELEFLALLAGPFALLLVVDVRVIVPVDFLAEHVVLLLEERVGWLHVVEVILSD